MQDEFKNDNYERYHKSEIVLIPVGRNAPVIYLQPNKTLSQDTQYRSPFFFNFQTKDL